MDAPKIIVEDGLVLTPLSAMNKPIAYIRADLVDQLIGYTGHDDGCQINTHIAMWDGPPTVCTCGLSDKIREVRGE